VRTKLDIKNQTPVRVQDGKLSDTQGKYFWSPKQRLFSRQYIGQLITKVVKIDSVVQHLIASNTLSEAETSSLRDEKVADSKFRHLLIIITGHCNRQDLEAFKTFIDILENTGNIDVAHPVSDCVQFLWVK
jgi:hypothetical protein